MPSLFKRANDMRKLCKAGFTVAEAHAFLSDVYAKKAVLRLPKHLVEIGERFINGHPLDGELLIQKQARSVSGKLKDIRKLYERGFSALEARRLISEIRDQKNDTLTLYPSQLKHLEFPHCFATELLTNMLPLEPHIRHIDFREPLQSGLKDFWKTFVRELPYTNVSRLTLRGASSDVILSADFPKINALSLQLKDKDDNVISNGINKNKELFKALATTLSGTKQPQSLKSLDVSMPTVTDWDVALIGELCSPELKHLSLKATQKEKTSSADGPQIEASLFRRALFTPNLETFSIDGIGIQSRWSEMWFDKAPKLKEFELKNAGLSSEAFDAMELSLSDSSIESLTLKNVTPLEYAQTPYFPRYDHFFDVIESGKTNLKKVSVTDTLHPNLQIKSNKLSTRLASVARSDVNAPSFESEKAAEASVSLFDAARDGTLKEFIEENGMPTADDFLKQGADGRTPVALAAESKQLACVFEEKNWANVKDMQRVFDKVPENEKYQLDGKDGRPSYQKVKNAVMAATVRKQVAAAKRER